MAVTAGSLLGGMPWSLTAAGPGPRPASRGPVTRNASLVTGMDSSLGVTRLPTQFRQPLPFLLTEWNIGATPFFSCPLVHHSSRVSFTVLVPSPTTATHSRVDKKGRRKGKVLVATNPSWPKHAQTNNMTNTNKQITASPANTHTCVHHLVQRECMCHVRLAHATCANSWRVDDWDQNGLGLWQVVSLTHRRRPACSGSPRSAFSLSSVSSLSSV